MKRITNYFLLGIIICILSSCGHAKNAQTVELGRYVMNIMKDDTRIPPSILIKEDSIMFTHTPYSSYMNIGKYIIEDDKLIITTDDELYSYTFEIREGSLYFIESESSEIVNVDERISVKVINNTEFVFQEELD